LKEKYLICDEAQNANAQLIKAVVTRAGTGTKIVVAGDPDQCDAPHLDKYTNGLVYVSEAMKGAPNTVILKFGEEQCERSNLAKIAIERMK
jgi:PhoH-like ATPase